MYKKLHERILMANRSRNIYFVMGQIAMAHELKAILAEDYYDLYAEATERLSEVLKEEDHETE